MGPRSVTVGRRRRRKLGPRLQIKMNVEKLFIQQQVYSMLKPIYFYSQCVQRYYTLFFFAQEALSEQFLLLLFHIARRPTLTFFGDDGPLFVAPLGLSSLPAPFTWMAAFGRSFQEDEWNVARHRGGIKNKLNETMLMVIYPILVCVCMHI